MPVIDIHTHCAPRVQGDPLGVAEALRGTPVGRNTVTNYRGLPAVSYHEMSDLDLQQEVCAKAGITGRIISNSFAAEVMTAVSTKPAIDVVKYVNDQNRRNRGALAGQLGARHAQPARCQPPCRRRALSRRARLQGPADLVELARPLHRRRGGVSVLGMGAGPPRCRSSSIRRGCRSGTSSRWISSSSTSWWVVRSTPPWRWRA